MIIKSASISKNYILNLSRLVLNILTLVFTMPYISRILGGEGIGAVEYPYAIVEYFIIFSAVGIPVYGIRQIAKCRDDVNERSRVVLELLTILGITTILAYSIFFLMLHFSGYNTNLKSMLAFLSIGIIFSNFSVEWFYQGIEDQQFITIRYIIIKIISVALLFLLVQTSADTIHYAFFLLFTSFGGSLFNLFNLRKYIKVNKNILQSLSIKRHIKPSITIFMASVSVSIYMLLDKIMLGHMVSETAVGYYSQAVKLPRQALVIVTAMGAVMLPRLSSLLHESNREEYVHYMQKSLRYILLVAVPATIIFFFLARPIIFVMADKSFEPAITTLKITSFNVFVVAIAYYIGFQVLYPIGKEKIYTIAVTVAAVINFIFNLYFIKSLEQDGAALGTLLAEFTGMAIMMVVARKRLYATGFFKPANGKYFIAGGIMSTVIYAISYAGLKPLEHLIIAISIGSAAYFVTLLLVNESIVRSTLQSLLSYGKNRT